MARRKKSTQLYRPFFRDAWRVTWERKGLWIFGIFAALISTGGVVDIVWRALEQVERAESLLKNLVDTSFIGYDLAASYIGQLAVLGPGRVTFMVMATTLIGVLLVVMATLSQGALLLGIGSRTAKDPYELRTQAKKHFWRFFLIGLFNKVLMLILIMLMTLPLWLISVSSATEHSILFFVLLCLFIPAAIIVNIIYMLALIDVVQTDAHPLDAIHVGAKLFARQWLASFEYGLILFLLVFGAGAILLSVIALLLVPYALGFTATMLMGSFPVFLWFNILSALVLIGVIITFGGATVTFQYAAWYHFYRRGVHRIHGKKVFSKIMRLVGRK
jgi:hypothetical protein